jgi:hypothetical protein
MIGLDYGADNKLRAHGPSGPVELPAKPRGMNPAEAFAHQLEYLLSLDDVTTESPTVGSSGAEPALIRDVVLLAPHRLYVISARKVKNLAKSRGLRSGDLTDAQAAEWIYQIATRPNAELRLWRYLESKTERVHTSVRPYDKRNYKDPAVDAWMALLPDFGMLPDLAREVLWNNRKRTPDYNRSKMLPFAMALSEPNATSRRGFEHVIGLYDNGYPSFYRRATVNLMQAYAKHMTGKTTVGELTDADRKTAWREVRRTLRFVYHASKTCETGT